MPKIELDASYAEVEPSVKMTVHAMEIFRRSGMKPSDLDNEDDRKVYAQYLKECDHPGEEL